MTRPSLYWSVFCCLLLVLSGCAEMKGSDLTGNVLSALSASKNGGALDEGTVAAGLKEALSVGSERAVSATSQNNGFWGNELIRISMPQELSAMETTLRAIGFGEKVDELELAMNRAAEKASAEAKPVLLNAVSEMTVTDAMGILRGGDTAATDYFKEKTSGTLREKFTPIVQEKMNQVGLYQQYNQLKSTYEALPLTKKSAFDLDQYVADQGIEGLFTMLAQEEKQIRANPAARTTELLKKVFAQTP